MRLLYRIALLLLISRPAAAYVLPDWRGPAATVEWELPPLVAAPRLTPGITVSVVPTPITLPAIPLVAPPPRPTRRQTEAANGAATVKWLRAHMNIRPTSNNRAPLIDQWARENGVAVGSEWCGLTQYAAQKANKLPWPGGAAGSYNWFKPGPRLVYQVGKKGALDSIRIGHKTGLYNPGKGRIAHIMACAEIVRDRENRGRPPRGFYTLAGNEGAGAKEGLHLTYYAASKIHSASNYNYR